MQRGRARCRNEGPAHNERDDRQNADRFADDDHDQGDDDEAHDHQSSDDHEEGCGNDARHDHAVYAQL